MDQIDKIKQLETTFKIDIRRYNVLYLVEKLFIGRIKKRFIVNHTFLASFRI